MRIAILARYSKLYTHQRLVEVGLSRGHEMRIINPLQCYMNIVSAQPSVRYRGGEILRDFDAIIPRIGSAHAFYGTAVLRQFESIGIFPLNESIAIARSKDKLRSLQLLAKKGLPMPATGFASSPLETEDLIDMVGGAPLVIKLLEGTQGRGVILADTKQSAASIIGAFKQLKANILVQAFIKEAQGCDLRCLVLGNKVIAAMQRQAKPGEFRSNIHQGGDGSAIKITSEERKLAIHATKVMGLKFAGVDIIRSKDGPLILEVNSSPGIEGIEMATHKDLASCIIKYIEDKAKLHHLEPSKNG